MAGAGPSAGRRRCWGWPGTRAEKKFEREWAGFSVVLLAGALVGSLLDPAFGPNLRTVVSYVAIVVAMAAGVYVSGLVTSSYHRARRHGKLPYKLEALPAGLAIGAACVLVSRGTGFEPGYLYGVICGVTFGWQLKKHEEAHLVALGSAAKVLLAVVAWLVWDGVHNYADKAGSFLGAVLLHDFLASLFVSSLVGTVISLFPLRFLPGHTLKSWRRGVWAATFGVSLFVLVQVLLRPHGSSGPPHTPLVTTLALFALFGLGSVLFRQHFVNKRRREEAARPGGRGRRASGASRARGASASATPGAGRRCSRHRRRRRRHRRRRREAPLSTTRRGSAGAAQTLLEGVHHLRAGHEVAERREVLDPVQAEPLEEQLGRPVQDRKARAGVPPHLDHVPALAERPQDAVGVDAPDARDLGPRNGLLVGDYRQGLQGRSREPGRLAFQYEAFDVRRHVGVALEPVPARHLGQDEPAPLGLVGLGQSLAQLLQPGRRDLEELGQDARLHGAVGDHQDRLDGAAVLRTARLTGEVARLHQPLYSSVMPAMARAAAAGPPSPAASSSSRPSQLMCSSASLPACSRSTAPRL